MRYAVSEIQSLLGYGEAVEDKAESQKAQHAIHQRTRSMTIGSAAVGNGLPSKEDPCQKDAQTEGKHPAPDRL